MGSIVYIVITTMATKKEEKYNKSWQKDSNGFEVCLRIDMNIYITLAHMYSHYKFVFHYISGIIHYDVVAH